jgi:hypothetical protein
LKFNSTKLAIAALVTATTFLFTSAFIPVSEAHILVIGDSQSDISYDYDITKNISNILKSKNYAVLELYRENATTKNILKGMYGADAVIYAGHGGYEEGHYTSNGEASPPFALAGSDDGIWGIKDKIREGQSGFLFTAPFKKNIPVILIGVCFSVGYAGDLEVKNPIETTYDFSKMFTGAGANYYATGWGTEIIQKFLNGAINFADANNKTCEPIITSTIFNGTQIWRNIDGHSAFVGNWSGKFPSAYETTPYNDIAAEKWYKSNRKTGYDYTSPTITSINPVNSATNVPRDKSITITFNEAIKAGNLNIVLKSSNGVVIPTKKSINANKLTISHSALLTPKTLYKIFLNTGSVTDLTGNSLQTKVMSFTTSPDKTAPKITLTYPKNHAGGVSRTKTTSIRLSENILKSVNWSKIYVKNLKTHKKCHITTCTDENHIYIKTSSKKSKYTWYQVYIPAAAVKDNAGNILTKGYTWKFKTGKY